MASVISEMETFQIINNNYSDLEADSPENGKSSPQSQLELQSKEVKQELMDGHLSDSSAPSSLVDHPGKPSSLQDMTETSTVPSTSQQPSKLPTPAITISGQISQAGRKKSNPAWEFFNDLRPQGINAVKCRYCDFCSEDRSPSAMRLHIRKSHDTGIGGLWYQLEQKTLQQVPHKYTKNRETPGAIGKKRESRDSNVVEVLNTPGYDETLLAAAKAFLLQNAALGTIDDPFNTNFLSALVQNPQVMQEVASVLSSNSSPPPADFQANIDVKQEQEVNGDHEAGSPTMPIFDIGNLKTDSTIIDVQNSTPSNSNTVQKNSRTNKWVSLGSFTNEADMLAVRTKEKVSKRRTETLKNGIKVRYRCNKWKKTKCAYQMYAFYWPEGKIDLYESGEHDHTGKNLGLYQGLTQTKPTPPMNPMPLKLSQEEILNNLLLQMNSGNSQAEVVTVGTSNVMENIIESPPCKQLKLDPALSLTGSSNLPSSSTSSAYPSSSHSVNSLPALLAALSQQSQNGHSSLGSIESKTDFILANGDSIASLLEIATELELVFTFNSRNTAEYCFQSNVESLRNRMVVLIDMGNVVQVSERLDSNSVKDENWIKGDWKQFLWAVRGKCLSYLKEAPNKPKRAFTLNQLL